MLSLFLCSCASMKSGNNKAFNYKEFKKHMHQNSVPPLSAIQQKMVARITFYHKREAGGDRIASSIKGRAKEGITIAAHPKFPFGTKIIIPALDGKIGDGEFTIEDRGTDVTKKKASHGKTFVFDVYVNVTSRKDAMHKLNALEEAIGDYTEVYILKDKI